MTRSGVLRLGLSLILLLAGLLIWALLYEIICAIRFNPDLPGEGTLRWGLLLQQAQDHTYHALLVPFQHFWQRIMFWRTRNETILRGSIALASTIATGLALALALYLSRPQRPYGDARFGNLLQADKARLTSKTGLVLGKLGSVILRSNDPAHVLVVGPTRSGKGVSFVIPNGYAWTGSAVWFDPKRENYQAFSSRRRELGDKVFLFSPGDRATHRYNPLDFIRRDERMPTDCLVVASFLIHDDGKEIWGRSARLLLSAMIGYVVAQGDRDDERHLRAVSQMTTTGEDFNKVLKGIVKQTGTIPKWIVDGFSQFIALEPETRNSALFNVTTALNPWNSDLIAAATATTDFDIRQLRKERISIFIGASIAELEIYRPLIKLLIQQIHDQLMHDLPGSDEPHQVLIMIDEFRQLGRMDDLVSKLTINAGYGFRMCLILQDLGQLDELYGRATRATTVSACQLKLFIRINDAETSDYVSEMLGHRTAEILTPMARSRQRLFQGRDHNLQYIQSPLRTAHELREMPERLAILLAPNSPGYELTKLRYYSDRPFKQVARRLRGVVRPPPPLDLSSVQARTATLPVSDPPSQIPRPATGAHKAPVIPRPAPAKPSFKKNPKPSEAVDAVSLKALVTSLKVETEQAKDELLAVGCNEQDELGDILQTFETEMAAFDAAEADPKT